MAVHHRSKQRTGESAGPHRSRRNPAAKRRLKRERQRKPAKGLLQSVGRRMENAPAIGIATVRHQSTAPQKQKRILPSETKRARDRAESAIARGPQCDTIGFQAGNGWWLIPKAVRTSSQP